VTEHVRAELHRSGGFTGRPVHVRLDSEQMSPAEAVQLVQLVSSIDLSRLPAGAAPAPPGADLMRYDLTIQRGGQQWHGTVSDPAVPSELRPLLQFLTTTR